MLCYPIWLSGIARACYTVLLFTCTPTAKWEKITNLKINAFRILFIKLVYCNVVVFVFGCVWVCCLKQHKPVFQRKTERERESEPKMKANQLGTEADAHDSSWRPANPAALRPHQHIYACRFLVSPFMLHSMLSSWLGCAPPRTRRGPAWLGSFVL